MTKEKIIIYAKNLKGVEKCVKHLKDKGEYEIVCHHTGSRKKLLEAMESDVKNKRCDAVIINRIDDLSNCHFCHIHDILALFFNEIKLIIVEDGVELDADGYREYADDISFMIQDFIHCHFEE